MPRVLLTGFCAVPGPRRSGVQMRHVIRALSPAHTVDVLVSREGEQGYVERQGSVRILRVPLHETDPRMQLQSFQRALRRQLEGADYDIVHCRDGWCGTTVLETRDHFDYRVVYDLSRSPLGETWADPDLGADYVRAEETCLSEADLVLAPTPSIAAALAARGREPERVRLSPPGVDIDRFDWDDPPGDGRARIVYTGAVDAEHGLRLLVRAMATIVRDEAARSLDVRLVIAGPIAPRFEAPLVQSIHELGLTERVELRGAIEPEHVPALLATATVCVVPAADGAAIYPTKLLEYMACRRAIVAPRRDVVHQVVENNRDALLFEPGEALDLARKILRLLTEPALRERLAYSAYDRVRRDFTASAARRGLRSAYAALVSLFSIRGETIEQAARPHGRQDVEVSAVGMLVDDEFEATVFDEAPVAPGARAQPQVTGSTQLEPLDEALASLDSATGTNSSVMLAPIDVDVDVDEEGLELEILDGDISFVAGEIDVPAER